MDQPSAKPRDNPWLDLVRLPSARRIVIMLFTSLALFIAFDRLLLQVMKRTPASNLAGRVLRDQELLLERPDARRLLALGDSRIKWMANPKLLSPGLGLPEGSGLNISLPATYVADDLAVLHWLESSGVLDDTKVLLWGMGFDRFHPDVHSPLNVHAFFDPWARGHRFNGISDAMFAAAGMVLITLLVGLVSLVHVGIFGAASYLSALHWFGINSMLMIGFFVRKSRTAS